MLETKCLPFWGVDNFLEINHGDHMFFSFCRRSNWGDLMGMYGDFFAFRSGRADGFCRKGHGFGGGRLAW